MVSSLEKFTLLRTSQNGFRRQRSTIDAIYLAVNKIVSSLNDGKCTLSMFLDLGKKKKYLCFQLEINYNLIN
ncbi:hypothetical protein HHI36_009366 [Cryptolaemus montrouzieri]|uniref:Reverse transcriptase domain-containing protein n=1 Tax=Cryptolaemus montrouzieri TaxID=559131 RepID=A0ABD2MV14_9CUCU